MNKTQVQTYIKGVCGKNPVFWFFNFLETLKMLVFWDSKEEEGLVRMDCDSAALRIMVKLDRENTKLREENKALKQHTQELQTHNGKLFKDWKKVVAWGNEQEDKIRKLESYLEVLKGVLYVKTYDPIIYMPLPQKS